MKINIGLSVLTRNLINNNIKIIITFNDFNINFNDLMITLTSM